MNIQGVSLVDNIPINYSKSVSNGNAEYMIDTSGLKFTKDNLENEVNYVIEDFIKGFKGKLDPNNNEETNNKIEPTKEEIDSVLQFTQNQITGPLGGSSSHEQLVLINQLK